MTRPKSWRRLLAVPAVLSLSLGGALLAAAPAQAAPGDPLVVLSPAEGSTPDARTFDVSGTGSDGAGIAILDEDDAIVVATTVEPGGAWSASVTYADDAVADQQLVITQVIDIADPSSVTEETLTITLPAATPVEPAPLVLTSPSDGDSIDSRVVDFEGTASVGATVTATVDDLPFGSIAADNDGNFSFQGFFPFELGNDVTVVITATATDETEADPVTVELSLLAPIAAPVITSPANGSSITGGTVTITGTATAGNSVAVLVLPTDLASPALGDVDPEALLPTAVVAADGTFTVSTTLPLGDYTATALQTETPADSIDSEVLSLPSDEVAFSLVAATAEPELAATGPTTTALTGPGALLMVAGLGLLVASRRRRVATV